jgi:uncharacterized protein with GYD domain
MPTYLLQVSYSPEGAKGVLKEGGTSRRELVRNLVEAGGGKLIAFYYAFGEADAYVIAEMPSNSAVTALSLNVSAAGAASLRTTVLISPEEVDEARNIQVNYRPPGG